MITVVTPSLNQASFISDAINSVLEQSYPDIDYRVMDGGSTDATLELLRASGNTFSWSSEQDEGQSRAINKGWRMCKSDIVSWLNADDYLLPESLATVAAAFQSQPELIAVYGNCDYVKMDGKRINPYPTRRFDYQALLRKAVNYIPQPAMFVKRSAVETVGYLDESLHYMMDYDLWLKIGLLGKTLYLPNKLACIRIHHSAKSLKSTARFGPELVMIVERMFDSGMLPANLQSLRRESVGNACLQAAYACFWSGEIAEARIWMKRCWKEMPKECISGNMLRLTAAVKAGKFGLKLMSKLKKHPFTLEFER
jgi:GT2 family glycosyltransferase